MYIEAVIIGILFGFLRGGSIGHLLEKEIKGFYICILALVLYVSPFLLKILQVDFDYSLLSFVSLCMLLLVALLNFRKLGFKLLFLGMILNIGVMFINGFKMSINLNALNELGYNSFAEAVTTGNVINYIDMIGTTKLSLFLGKVIMIPKLYPFAKVLSIGDIISSIGIIFIISAYMKPENRMGMYSYSSRYRNIYY